MGVAVQYTGPLFDGTADDIVDKHLTDMERALGQEVYEVIKGRLPSVLVAPTGRYQSTIHVADKAAGVVVGDGTVYGPWLEGTGSRNRSTRFKGYQTFRKATQEVQQRADAVVQSEVDTMVRELNS